MNTLQRIKQYIDYKGITNKEFEKNVGFSNGAFASQLKKNRTIGVDKLENILSVYPELSAEWLLRGEGNMLREQQIEIKTAEPKEYEDKIWLLENAVRDKEKIIKLQEQQLKESKKVNLEMPPLSCVAEPRPKYPTPPLTRESDKKHAKKQTKKLGAHTKQ